MDKIPFPPMELRKIVGPLEDSFYDNRDGEFVYGPLDFGPLRPGEAYQEVFDFGCGCGRVARQLMLQKQLPKKYLGIDISKTLIDWATKNLSSINPNFRFLHHEVYNLTYAPDNSKNRYLPFPANSSKFTLFNAHSVFTHLLYDQTEYYLKEALRILKPHGIMWTTWFFFNKEFFPMMTPNQHCLYVNEIDVTQAVYYDWGQFLKLVDTLGLSILKVVWTKVKGFQNVVILGRKGFFEDVSKELCAPSTIVGY